GGCVGTASDRRQRANVHGARHRPARYPKGARAVRGLDRPGRCRELPFAKPQRPSGIERNVVITLWDWGHPTSYLHDAISTDRRNPRLNANGKIYGSPEDSTDFIPILDPVTNTASEVKHPVRESRTPNAKFN